MEPIKEGMWEGPSPSSSGKNTVLVTQANQRDPSILASPKNTNVPGAGTQKRSPELERFLASLARDMLGVGIPISSVPVEIQRQAEGLERLNGKSRDKSWEVTAAPTIPHSDKNQRKNDDLNLQIAESKEVYLTRPVPFRSAGNQQRDNDLEWQQFRGPHEPINNPLEDSTEVKQLNRQKIVDIDGTNKPATGAPVSLRCQAMQQKNEELEKRIALQMQSTKLEISSHSLALQQRNEEIERKLAQFEAKQRSNREVRLSPATQAMQQRNLELERKLSDTNRTGNGQPGRINSSPIHIQLRNKDYKRPLAEFTKAEGSKSNRPIQINYQNMRRLNSFDKQRAEIVSAREFELEEMMKKAQELDLVFLVDVTGSMKVYIDMVKEKVADIANGIKKAYSQVALRVAFAPYRDYGDTNQDIAETCDFTSSFEGQDSKFVRALTSVQTVGGRDAAEDVFSGLERVANLSWRATTRVLVHIADAPCHGVQFHDGSVGDDYPQGDRQGGNIGRLLKVLRDDCQISSYLFCHVNGSTRKMIMEFKMYAAGKDSPYWIKEEQLSSNVSNLVQFVVTNSCSSIALTMTNLAR